MQSTTFASLKIAFVMGIVALIAFPPIGSADDGRKETRPYYNLGMEIGASCTPIDPVSGYTPSGACDVAREGETRMLITFTDMVASSVSFVPIRFDANGSQVLPIVCASTAYTFEDALPGGWYGVWFAGAAKTVQECPDTPTSFATVGEATLVWA